MTAIYVFAAIGMVVTTIIATATIVGIITMITAAIAERNTSGPPGRDCYNS